MVRFQGLPAEEQDVIVRQVHRVFPGMANRGPDEPGMRGAIHKVLDGAAITKVPAAGACSRPTISTAPPVTEPPRSFGSGRHADSARRSNP